MGGIAVPSSKLSWEDLRLPAIFLIYFIALGLLIPYLPKYLQELGFTGKQISYINMMGPLATILATPVWGFIADRSGNLPRLLRWLTFGAALTLAPILGLKSFFAIACVIAFYSVFLTSISPLIDALAVADARRRGTEYARMRLFGSIGFTVALIGFGYALDFGLSTWSMLPGALIFLALTGALMFTLKNDTSAVRAKPPTMHDSLRLCARPEVLLFMLSGMIHWGTMCTYNSFFAIHMTNLKAPAYYIGLGMSAGVFTEILAMWYFRKIRQTVPLLPLLLIGEFSTVVRWLAVGQIENPIAVAALQAMHGLTFGMYFPACIDYLERVAPPEMRSTGRAVFASIAMGMGGVLGNLLAGNMYDIGGKGIAGGQYAFTVAGAVELAAPLLMLGAWYFIPRQLPALDPSVKEPPPPSPSVGESA